jgi:hypothetical protein
MQDWYVGQRIACINDQPIGGVVNRFVNQHLREGQIYIIREIVLFKFMRGAESQQKLAFRLEGIVPHLILGTEYAFFHGRFRPLEDGEDKEINISVFLDILREINEGGAPFLDEDIEELDICTSR